ncbi:sulfatase-like hydrolase/transferase [Arenibacter sp. 6A1]|uniref:sulfatase family protein n=1 Tax=Arenibacter sp. 6A1 TaxID=2720391 RepID=UPI001444E5D0|nr:sulfatase-like hydrolase/transferase [Arenibacter sp. 6A1]NKI27372.1 sulfatase-like hydrolase/transferase [Arenibacter sp. 6A1]
MNTEPIQNIRKVANSGNFLQKVSNTLIFIVVLLVFQVSQAQKSSATGAKDKDRPNIVLIMTDQHQAAAMSIAGNTDLETPNLDKLAKNGVRFNNAYVTFPLCSPSRSSIFTGKMPHTLGVNSNVSGDNRMSAENKEMGLGHIMQQAGYDCAYGGKWHAHEAAISEGNGFEKIADFGDIPLAEKCIDYMASKKDGNKPFFLVASFDNPHNICEWARNEPLPYGNIPMVPLSETPGLPPNFKKSETFPEALQIEQDVDKKVYPTQNYTEEDWRQYRYTYYRLVEKVDREIGKIIDAIDAMGLSDNTLIIFTSDHGDGNASHGWNQKTALFQESVKVPFIMTYKGKKGFKKGVDQSLISNGLDLYPTICDYAGIPIPAGLLGESIKPRLEGNKKSQEREFVVVETKFEGKQAYGTLGRALIGKKYKYVLYSWGKNREQLFDLENDPFEMNNLVHSGAYLEKLDEYRQKLLEWCKETNDTKFLRKVILPTNSTISSSELFDKPY